MPPPEDVTRNQVMRTIMIPSTTEQFNDLLRSMLIVCSAHTRRLGYRSAPQKEMYNNIWHLLILPQYHFLTFFSDWTPIKFRYFFDKIPIFLGVVILIAVEVFHQFIIFEQPCVILQRVWKLQAGSVVIVVEMGWFVSNFLRNLPCRLSLNEPL